MEIVIIGLALVFLYIFCEGIGKGVYGPLLKDSELLPFLEKNLSEYEVNDVSYRCGRQMLMTYDGRPYIARGCGSVLAVWHLSDTGRVPIWSESHKILEKRWAEIEKPKEKTLADY